MIMLRIMSRLFCIIWVSLMELQASLSGKEGDHTVRGGVRMEANARLGRTLDQEMQEPPKLDRQARRQILLQNLQEEHTPRML